MNEPWYKSKTKVGAVLVGGGMILTACGKCLLGEIDLTTAVVAVIAGIGIILTAIGLRDAIEKK